MKFDGEIEKIICCDKNQVSSGYHRKSNALKHKNLIEMGYTILPIPLPFGDYCFMNKEILETIQRRGNRLKKQDLVADYKVAVDTKKDLQELIGNVCQGHDRFRNELILAKKMNCQLYVLIEELNIHSIDDIQNWQNPRLKKWLYVEEKQKQGKMLKAKHRKKPPMSGETLAKVLKTMESKYNCKFIFTSRNDCAEKIIELLRNEK